jgi:hypothetical protein
MEQLEARSYRAAGHRMSIAVNASYLVSEKLEIAIVHASVGPIWESVVLI